MRAVRRSAGYQWHAGNKACLRPICPEIVAVSNEEDLWHEATQRKLVLITQGHMGHCQGKSVWLAHMVAPILRIPSPLPFLVLLIEIHLLYQCEMSTDCTKPSGLIISLPKYLVRLETCHSAYNHIVFFPRTLNSIPAPILSVSQSSITPAPGVLTPLASHLHVPTHTQAQAHTYD